MNINDVVNMSADDVMALTEKELYKQVQHMRKVAMQRVGRARKSDNVSPAIKALESNGGMIDPKEKNLNELREEFYRGKKFYKSKTSTYKGYKNWKKQYSKLLGTTEPIDKQAENRMWDAFNKLQEMEPNFFIRNQYGKLISSLYNSAVESSMSVDELIEQGLTKIDSDYIARNANETTDESEFFTI